MTVFPCALDDDRTILRIDSNLSEMGDTTINQLRSAVFAIEKEIGIKPSGTMSSLNARVSVSLNDDGTLKATALAAAGLVTLPIVDNEVANNAGIKEFKLALDVSTLSLQAQINAVDIVATNAASLATETNADLLAHIAGVATLLDGLTPARHVASQIDLNAFPFDPRDPAYIWTGLRDKNGTLRSATQTASGLLQVNDDLTGHENAVADAHPATAITVDAADWVELPTTSQNVQEVFDFIDNQEVLSTGVDRATLNSNGIPRNARVQRLDLDGYNYQIVPVTKVRAYLAEPSKTSPRDAISNGDDVISFVPDDDSDYSFDSLFTMVQVGDIIRVNYGSGIGGMFRISSIRFVPGSEWVVRIDGFNLADRDGGVDGYAYARIDRRRHDIETQGVLAVAAAHANVTPAGLCGTTLDSVIIGSPRGAMAIGLGFDAGAINTDHYNLWLRLYPGGDPTVFTDLAPIDITGNVGTTPGAYTLDGIVESTNRAFRAGGYNYRFIAFQQDGEFGIMLADCWNKASFAIITGLSNGTSIIESTYIKNVVGDATDGWDALGFGATRAVVASPVNTGFSTALEATNFSTIIHAPTRGRDYLSDGARRDFLKTKDYTVGDGYWNATVLTTFVDNPNGTVTCTYRVPYVLFSEEVMSGKTLVVQPVDPTNADINGYGRFIIGDVTYDEGSGHTDIMVVNACHDTADPLGTVLPVGTAVRIYFTEDSVGFNLYQLESQGLYHRYHEIYADSAAKTNAVERARMEKQSVDITKLNTDLNNWQIRNVSTQMRGYRINSDLRFWLRFYVVAYNNITGEFDGYVGEPPPVGDGIIDPGPLTRGTKNRPVRFYDRTNVNFIDIEFRELAVTPGTIIASNPPQYIDIEIFQSFSTDEEEFRIAGVSHNETVVGSITDLREFGTTSEENFTDSAIAFIEAGERYLHTNGVVRGLNYLGTGISDATLRFGGGIGLVNGSFVAVDDLSCTIPQVRESSTPILNFYICLTQDGTLRAVPENNGAQFFDLGTGEFIESFTFADIVDNHKELLVLHVANVTIASVTLNYQLDARRFVQNESTNGFSLSVSPSIDPEANDASFHSIEAMNVWLGLYDIKEIQVKEVNIETFTTIDPLFYGGLRKVILRGGTWNVGAQLTVQDGPIFDGASFIITSWNGLYIQDVRVENCQLIYEPANPPPVYVTGDMVNAGLGYAIRVGDRCVIYNNSFFGTFVGTQRPPFIYRDEIAANQVQDILIRGNKFSDVNNTNNCAVCFVSTQQDSSQMFDVFIEQNVCVSATGDSGNQSIVLVGSIPTYFGWRFFNVRVQNNSCGVIGYLSSGRSGGRGSVTDLQPDLEISGNACRVILSATAAYSVSTGHSVSTGRGVGSGFVTIRENNVIGKIRVYVSGDNSPVRLGSVNIENNTVYAIGNTTVYAWHPGSAIYGINVEADIPASAAAAKNMMTNVIGNKVYLTDTSTGALAGIYVDSNCNIINNHVWVGDVGSTHDEPRTITLIRNFTDALDYRTVALIQGNQLYKNGQVIDYYVCAGAAIATVSALSVVDNFLDSHLVDDSDSTSWTKAIFTAQRGTTISRNKNHMVQQTVWPCVGALGVAATDDAVLVGIPPTRSSFVTGIADDNSFKAEVWYTDQAGPDLVIFTWYLQLLNIIPNGVRVTDVTGYFSVAIDPPTGTGNIDEVLITYYDTVNTKSTASPVSWVDGFVSVPVLSTWYVTETTAPYVVLQGKVKQPSNSWNGFFNSLKITYIW